MKMEQRFKQILADTGQIFRNARPGPDCPSVETLAIYADRELAEKEAGRVAVHVAGCEVCQMVVMRLESDQYLWDAMLEHDQETALGHALGKKGQKVVHELIEKTAARQAAFVSKIKETMVAWASPLWQPFYAGEAVTAADIEQQSTRFEMDYGEYINLSCYWQEEKAAQPYIDLSWQANLLQPSRLWARFIDPDSSRILTEIFLGSDLEGKIRIVSNELSFNPTSDKWAIAIVVEE